MAKWQELKDAKDPSADQKPVPPLQFIVNDTTTEKLGEILSRQDRGVLVEQDELSGWIGALDRYRGGGRGGASADRAFWLKAYDGGSRRIDRIGRGSTFVENLSVSMLGGIQPKRLKELGNLQSDGLLQRFWPVMMRQPARPQEVADQAPFAAYRDLVTYLTTARPYRLLLSDEALAEANRFRDFTFETESVDGLGDSFCSFIGKLNGLHGSLMIVLHMATDPQNGPYEPVSEDTAKAATLLLKNFAIPHARALYQETTDGVDRDDQRSLFSFVLTSPKNRFTVSDFTSGVHALRGRGELEVAQKVSIVVANGWLTAEDTRGVVKAWRIIPGVRELLSERYEIEKERKAKVVRAIQELSGRSGLRHDDHASSLEMHQESQVS